MNKNKIISLVEQNFLTLRNLEKSIEYALNSRKSTEYKRKVMYSAFSRTSKIIEKRNSRLFSLIGISQKDRKNAFLKKMMSIKSPMDNYISRSKNKPVNTASYPPTDIT